MAGWQMSAASSPAGSVALGILFVLAPNEVRVARTRPDLVKQRGVELFEQWELAHLERLVHAREELIYVAESELQVSDIDEGEVTFI